MSLRALGEGHIWVLRVWALSSAFQSFTSGIHRSSQNTNCGPLVRQGQLQKWRVDCDLFPFGARARNCAVHGSGSQASSLVPFFPQGCGPFAWRHGVFRVSSLHLQPRPACWRPLVISWSCGQVRWSQSPKVDLNCETFWYSMLALRLSQGPTRLTFYFQVLFAGEIIWVSSEFVSTCLGFTAADHQLWPILIKLLLVPVR